MDVRFGLHSGLKPDSRKILYMVRTAIWYLAGAA
jgi:hypothetical protein